MKTLRTEGAKKSIWASEKESSGRMRKLCYEVLIAANGQRSAIHGTQVGGGGENLYIILLSSLCPFL